ncbi:MAG TPA: hypothetical protein DCS55_15065 [Acidimicrobiaceae bacterium]|nr:hypothetical protein [Acidimicrobiaceae bacterium]
MNEVEHQGRITRRRLLTGLGAASAVGVAGTFWRPLLADARTIGETVIGTASEVLPGDPRTPDGTFYSWNDPQAWPNGRVPGPNDKAVVDRHVVVSGDITVAAIEVKPGGLLRYEPNTTTTIQSRGNVVVAGQLTMRPSSQAVGHTLRFIEVDESKYVGGGMKVLDSDVGLWIIDHGVLDAVGTPKAGWNRSGDDPTWLATDEIVSAPNAKGDFTTFARFTKGAAVPLVQGPDGAVPTEVLNLTRNVWIEGTPGGRAHVMFLHCHQPQTVRYIGIRHMGPRQDTGDTFRASGSTHAITEGVLGRYGLHLHHCQDGTRGSLIEGVVVRDAGNVGFVPHMSHGITLRDCIAYRVHDHGFWWDHGDVTHDVTYDHCAVMLVSTSPDFRGYETTGFTLGEGRGTVATDCVAVGVRSGSVNAGAFLWPHTANHKEHNVWRFEDCVAHNNREVGFATWQNDSNAHFIDGLLSYHNGVGISHGAYVNEYTYRRGTTFGNDTEIAHRAMGPITFERMRFYGKTLIAEHALKTDEVARYVNCMFAGPIVIDEGKEPGVLRFESTSRQFDLTPDRFEVGNVLSKITVVNSDGSTFVVR